MNRELKREVTSKALGSLTYEEKADCPGNTWIPESSSRRNLRDAGMAAQEQEAALSGPSEPGLTERAPQDTEEESEALGQTAGLPYTSEPQALCLLLDPLPHPRLQSQQPKERTIYRWC